MFFFAVGITSFHTDVPGIVSPVGLKVKVVLAHNKHLVQKMNIRAQSVVSHLKSVDKGYIHDKGIPVFGVTQSPSERAQSHLRTKFGVILVPLSRMSHEGERIIPKKEST